MARAFAVLHIREGEVALIRVENNVPEEIVCRTTDQEGIQTVRNQIGRLNDDEGVQFIIANTVTKNSKKLVTAFEAHRERKVDENILLLDLINIVKISHREQQSYDLMHMIDFVLDNRTTPIGTALQKARAYLAIFREANAKIGEENEINMATLLAIAGGALVNALAFSGTNFFFSKLSDHGENERKRHDKAVEDLQKSEAAWRKKRQERIDFINEELQQSRRGLSYNNFKTT